MLYGGIDLGQGLGQSDYSDKGPGFKRTMFASIAWRNGKRVDVVRSVFRQDGFFTGAVAAWLVARKGDLED